MAAKKKTTIKQLRDQADGGDANAQSSLALLLEMGLEGEPDIKEAKKYWSKAASAGNRMALMSLAEIVRHGLDGEAPHRERAAKISALAGVKERRDKLTALGGNKRTVLVVDDSQVIRQKVATLLKDQGFDVVVASSGQKALNLLRSQPIHLVITDIEMPEMSGYTLVEKLRSREEVRDLPVIVLTSVSSKEAIVKMKKLGVDGWVIKPPEKGSLEKLCGRLVERYLKGR